MPHFGNVAAGEMGGDYWTFPARVTNIVDGDTLDVLVDMGFDTRRDVRVRLYGVNTAEIYGRSKDSDEYKRGIVHRDFVDAWVVARQRDAPDDAYPFHLLAKKRIGIYGRYTADLLDATNGVSLVNALIQAFDDV